MDTRTLSRHKLLFLLTSALLVIQLLFTPLVSSNFSFPCEIETLFSSVSVEIGHCKGSTGTLNGEGDTKLPEHLVLIGFHLSDLLYFFVFLCYIATFFLKAYYLTNIEWRLRILRRIIWSVGNIFHFTVMYLISIHFHII
jgi:hypothetical protein